MYCLCHKAPLFLVTSTLLCITNKKLSNLFALDPAVPFCLASVQCHVIVHNAWKQRNLWRQDTVALWSVVSSLCYDVPCAPECPEPVRAKLLWCLFSSWFLCPLTGSSLPAPFFYQLRQDPGSFVHSGTQHIRVRGRRCEQLGSDTWDRRGAC